MTILGVGDMRNREPLDEFGQLLMEHLRDRAIGFYDILAQGKWKAPAFQSLQVDLASFTDQQRAIIRLCVIASIDTAIHDFLLRVQEETDNPDEGHIQIMMDGVNVAALSDGLQGELFSEDGWRARYSVYGEPLELL